MGNIWPRRKKKLKDPTNNVTQVIPSSAGYTTVTLSPVQQWEEKQKEQNALVMARMREDFHNRPDNFLLNLLVVSVQFYRNFGKEKVDISNHIRDREQAISQKLTASKRKIIYLGGFEEISGTHVLYQAKDEKYMELPTPLQIYIVQDNLEVHPDDQYEDLQLGNYADVDGPSYRFCTEYSKRHMGYARLRCADIIPGLSRSNTYEDIYAFMTPVDESQPDPVVDVRPLRRNSAISTTDDEDTIPILPKPYHPALVSFSLLEEEEEEEDEEEDEDDFDEEMTQPPPSIMGRRPSGIMPINYPSSNLLKNQKNKKPQQNGFPGAKVQMKVSQNPVPNLSERRLSGLFPKMSPNMDKLSFSKKEQKKIKNEDEFANLKRVLAEIEEESEDDEVDGDDNDGDRVFSLPILKDLHSVAPEPPQEEEEDNSNKETEAPRLHASLNTGCFVNRKIKLRVEGDAYGIKTHTELRTYFASARYLHCFEEDFEQLMDILGKPHLVDSSNMQMPAILANELMIEGIGPKFNTEFIPSVVLKEWPHCAFEWKLRERKPRTDPETKTLYRWPKPHYIHEVSKMGCNMVPIGHYSPARPNTVMQIEWQIQFARAEQLLLRSLGHTQMRLLLFVEFLMRDHLKDIPGLKTQHLRYILFWMCEHNFRDWEEERLGNKLKAYLKTLYNCLSTENLPHYFIDKCNLMETIPERYLRQIQALVRHMKDNLPIYLMHTMRRMRTEDDFYPMLDIKELYKLVTPEHYGMENINPALLNLMGGDDQPVEMDDGEDVLYSDSEEEREHVQMKAKLNALRQQRSRKENETASAPEKKRKPSTINLRRKVQNVKDLRSGKLLSMFAKHFIQMARSSNEYRSYPQSYMYLLLAGNMATLLEETGNGSDAKDFRKEIEDLNLASRGGVQDMLGSSWTIADNYDIIPGNPTLRTSNWELKKDPQPLPKPPKESTPINGVKFLNRQENGLGSNLSNLENSINSRPYLSHTISSQSDDIIDLPDSPMNHDFKMVIISDDEELTGSTNL